MAQGAPIGNKFAKGHGRPPNQGYSNQELIILGEELVQWINDKFESKERPVHLSEWYSEVKGIPRSQWESIIKRESFLGYYERAKEWMGKNLLLNRKIPSTYGMKFLSVYFKEIADQEKELIKFKIDYEYEKKSAVEKESTQVSEDWKKRYYESELKLMEVEKKLEALSKTDPVIQ